MWLFTLGGIHLVNSTGTPVAGGSPLLQHSTPFALGEGWTPQPAEPQALWQGGAPLAHGQQLAHLSYNNVEETIPIKVVGTSADNVAQKLQQLKKALATASYSTPAVWRARPFAATNDAYAEVYSASVTEKTTNERNPIEGGTDLEAEITLTRSPFFGAKDLQGLLTAQSFTNTYTGNVVSLGSLFGDLAREGQPLNYTVSKPAAQSAATLLLATIHSQLSASLAESKTTTSTTTGTAYTSSAALDVSALKARKALSLRVLARFKTLTNPSKAQAQLTLLSNAGSTLWQGQWVRLSTDTTAQLLDMGGTTLDAIRVPATTTISIKASISLRSTDGTSVTAMLDYVEALLCYDVAIVECAAGLATGQHYELQAAQNLSGGGWQPLTPDAALALDAADVAVKPARIRGTLPRAFEGCSLYVAWYDAGRAHTDTDTVTITVEHAPLWRTLRGLT